MNKDFNSPAPTQNQQEYTNRILSVLEKYPNQLNSLILLKTMALVKYKNEMSDNEINGISEFEFTINPKNGILTYFEYWTNSKRTKGYTIFNIEEMQTNITDIL